MFVPTDINNLITDILCIITIMITKSWAVEIQHLDVNHESQPIKSNPVMPS